MSPVTEDGAESGLDALATAAARTALSTVTVTGTGQAAGELSVPYRGERLVGSALLSLPEAWAADGVIEPSYAEAVRTVAACPEWLAPAQAHPWRDEARAAAHGGLWRIAYAPRSARSR